MRDEIKTIQYEVKVLPDHDHLYVVKWKTRGNPWHPWGKAPTALRDAVLSEKFAINGFRRCRSGKFFCGTITVSSKLTRMGAYLRRRRRGENEKVDLGQVA